MTISVEALEQVAARAWPPARLEQLGGWRLGASSGFSGRANCCWPIGAPDIPLAKAIEHTEAWYAARGLPALFKIADVADSAALVAALSTRGYRPHTESLTMTGPLADGAAGAATVSEAMDAGFTGLFVSVQADPADARERIETLERIAPPRAFAQVRVNGHTAAIGAGAVDGEWAGVFGMRTAPAHRRQGLARAVLTALAAAALKAGASRAYLQVEADNAGAIRLYRDVGFVEAYRYRYWSRG